MGNVRSTILAVIHDAVTVNFI